MNQYRCETCKKPHKVPDGLSRNPHFFCCDKEMPYETAIVTMIRGCTSHSDYRNGLDIPEILESLCNIDLAQYSRGEREAEDVGKCHGTTCNYCGRYKKVNDG